MLDVDAGSKHVTVLLANGTALSWSCTERDWGSNLVQLTKVPASAKANVTGVCSGGFHSLAVKGDGSVIGW